MNETRVRLKLGDLEFEVSGQPDQVKHYYGEFRELADRLVAAGNLKAGPEVPGPAQPGAPEAGKPQEGAGKAPGGDKDVRTQAPASEEARGTKVPPQAGHGDAFTCDECGHLIGKHRRGRGYVKSRCLDCPEDKPIHFHKFKPGEGKKPEERNPNPGDEPSPQEPKADLEWLELILKVLAQLNNHGTVGRARMAETVGVSEGTLPMLLIKLKDRASRTGFFPEQVIVDLQKHGLLKSAGKTLEFYKILEEKAKVQRVRTAGRQV